METTPRLQEMRHSRPRTLRAAFRRHRRQSAVLGQLVGQCDSLLQSLFYQRFSGISVVANRAALATAGLGVLAKISRIDALHDEKPLVSLGLRRR